MAESTANYERGIDASGLSLVSGDRPATERLLRAAIQKLEELDGSRRELASALIEVGTLRQEIGNHAEAEELFRKAVEVGEGAPASDDHPDLVILLNDLTRLCLKHSAHAVAEPLLLRLLSIKRSKGEDHPEVATVLASLAVVRQALGQHESAEQLWRRVLDIRERTLAPNHFALAIALEHLAEACVARGKLGEALHLFERAQTIRERTLGGDHSSVRMSRERIADLQLQASEESLEIYETPGPGLAPDRLRLLSATRSDATAPLPLERESSVIVPEGRAAPVVGHDPSRISTKQDAAPPPADAAAMSDADPTPGRPVAAYRDIIMSIERELEDAPEGETLRNRAEAMLASAVALVRQRQKAFVVGAGALAFIFIAFTADSHAWGEPNQAQADAVAPHRALPSVTTASISNVSTPPVAATKDPLKIAVAASPISASRSTPTRSRVTEQPGSGKKGNERGGDQARISIPKLPNGVMVGLDSAILAASASSRGTDENFPIEPAMSTNTQRPSFANVESTGAPTRARLIGDVPTPRYPRELSGVEGETVVRFTVDATGRPMMSTLSVVKSPDPVLTAAVRRVISGLRFEPARTAGPDSKPTVDSMELSFTFRPSK